MYLCVTVPKGREINYGSEWKTLLQGCLCVTVKENNELLGLRKSGVDVATLFKDGK